MSYIHEKLLKAAEVQLTSAMFVESRKVLTNVALKVLTQNDVEYFDDTSTKLSKNMQELRLCLQGKRGVSVRTRRHVRYRQTFQTVCTHDFPKFDENTARRTQNNGRLPTDRRRLFAMPLLLAAGEKKRESDAGENQSSLDSLL
jgi:hypothetical protein